jgi:dihydrofolate synthase/folylpolyglutamate synthase
VSAFNSASQVFAYLDNFLSRSGAAVPKTLRGERLALMAEAASHPESCAPVFHVAGSKGKGSVTGMLTAILGAAGKRVAQYVSPHVADPRERITLGFKYLDEALYASCGDELRALNEKLSDKNHPKYHIFHGAEPHCHLPAYFELLTFYYFLCARAARADVMTVETGMGGRFDPTNVVKPLASLITVIEIEHSAILGSTIEEIAFEKAGIIKENTPVFLAGQTEAALRVFTEAAAKKNAPLYYLPRLLSIEDLSISHAGCAFTLVPKSGAPFDKPLPLSVGIPCAAQAENAALAVLALKTTLPHISDDEITRALSPFTLPARFERLPFVPQQPPAVIDGAHTPLSVTFACKSWTSLYGEGGILLFACADDKNAALMAEILVPHFRFIIVTTPGYYKTGDSARVYALFSDESAKQKVQSELCMQPELCHIADTKSAIDYARRLSLEQKLPLFCTGSFYLAAEVRAAVAA